MVSYAVNSDEVVRQAAQVQQYAQDALAEIAKVRTAIFGVEVSSNAVKGSAEALAGSWQGQASENFQAEHADTHRIFQQLVQQGQEYASMLDRAEEEVQRLAEATRSVGTNYGETEQSNAGVFRV
jgi:uncharacterized protein YukE